MGMARQSGRLRKNTGQYRRILAATLALVLAFVPVTLRLWQLMVAEYDYYASAALRNQSRTTAVRPDRGTIYDRNLEVLAASVSRENLYLDPQELKQSRADISALAAFLAPVVEKDADWVAAQAVDYTKRYKQIGAQLPQEEGDIIRAYLKETGISGVHLEPTAARVYPNAQLACQVLGFVNSSGDGCEGIEAAYDSFLKGKNGAVITTKGSNEMDMPFSYERFQYAGSGASLVLTLDKTVQSSLEARLQEAVHRYDVQNGAFGVVMNCKTGEILAMATLGGFDPNCYLEIGNSDAALWLEELRLAYLALPEGSEERAAAEDAYRSELTQTRLKQWRNRVISDGYEPGSTFKVLTMAAALDSGAIDLNTPFYCRGAEQIPGRSQLLHCWRSAGHGAEKTPQALQNSCNIAFAHIALKLGGERFYEYIQRFGILEKTGIDLAGESKGVFFDKSLITNTEKWGTASLTSGSFGQTFKITPMQLVRAISSVVNGGLLPEPYLVSEILDENGKLLYKQEPVMTRRTIREETSETMRMLIRSVVTEGTAKNAAVAGFSVGGKTGTSEKIDVFDAQGNRVTDKIVSFVGIAPMEDPQYIVLAALDTPSKATGIYISGGVMAAPTVGNILSDILTYLEAEKTPGEATETAVPNCVGLSAEEGSKLLKKAGFRAVVVGSEGSITAQIPGAGEMLGENGQVQLQLENGSPGKVTVPDFAGMNRQQAADMAGRLTLNLKITGNPEVTPEVTAVFQSIPAGESVPAGTVVTLEFLDTHVRD